MAVLSSGTAISQLLGVIAAPLISRLYSPGDFGTLASLLSVTGVINVVICLKYEMAIVIEQEKNRVIALNWLCLAILLVITVFSVAAVFFATGIFMIVKDPVLANLLPWGCLILFLAGLQVIGFSLFNRERSYAAIAKTQISQRLGTTGSQIAFGFFGGTAFGLVLGNVVGLFAAVMLMFAANGVKAFVPQIKSKHEDLLSVFKYYSKFPLLTAPQSLISAMSLFLPVYVLGPFYGAAAVGSYWLGMRILMLPATLVGSSVRQVLLKEYSDRIEDSLGLQRLFWKATLGLMGIIFVPAVIIFIWGPELFSFAFGGEWVAAGQYARWMILFLAASFCNPPAVVLCQVMRKNSWHLLFEILQGIGRLIFLLVPALLGETVLVSIACYSVFGTLTNIFFVGCIAMKLFNTPTRRGI